MKDLIKTMDNLPKIIKIILAIPCLDIIWGIYRVIKGVAYKNVITLIFGILWIVPGSFICWIVDLCTLILSNKLILADA